MDREKIREAVKLIEKHTLWSFTEQLTAFKLVLNLAELYLVGKLVEPMSQSKMYEKLRLINKIACQRFQYPRDSNEDNEGWLEIANISAEALVGKIGGKK